MPTEFNIPQVIPLITVSAFELVLERIFQILKDEEINQRLQADNSGKAQGTLTLVVNPVDGDFFQVGTKVYTLQTTLTNMDGNIQIGATLLETQSNIVAAFDLSGAAGVQYATLMTANADVDIAEFVENESILTAKLSGEAGNTIVTTSTFTDGGNSFDGVTLGTTRAGKTIDADDFGYATYKNIANPWQAFDEFSVPVVNVFLLEGIPKERSKVSTQVEVTYGIQIFAAAGSTDTDQGSTLSLGVINRVMRQILYILLSPKYKNLGFNYQDSEGILVKFIEKLSLSELRPDFPKEPLPKENVTMGILGFKVELIENLFDLQGTDLEEIFVKLLEPIVQGET